MLNTFKIQSTIHHKDFNSIKKNTKKILVEETEIFLKLKLVLVNYNLLKRLETHWFTAISRHMLFVALQEMWPSSFQFHNPAGGLDDVAHIIAGQLHPPILALRHVDGAEQRLHHLPTLWNVPKPLPHDEFLVNLLDGDGVVGQGQRDVGVGEICAKALPRHVGWEWRAYSGAGAVVARGDGEVDGQLGMEGRA